LQHNNLFLRGERITHCVEAELAWTIFPVVFLIGIGIPSMGCLYFEDGFYIYPIMSIKATGNQ
jgi:heme/copper-type cytochrome/quinol oxidase subunit 2